MCPLKNVTICTWRFLSRPNCAGAIPYTKCALPGVSKSPWDTPTDPAAAGPWGPWEIHVFGTSGTSNDISISGATCRSSCPQPSTRGSTTCSWVLFHTESGDHLHHTLLLQDHIPHQGSISLPQNLFSSAFRTFWCFTETWWPPFLPLR